MKETIKLLKDFRVFLYDSNCRGCGLRYIGDRQCRSCDVMEKINDIDKHLKKLEQAERVEKITNEQL